MTEEKQMASEVSRKMFDVADIDDKTRGWTAIVQVIERHRPQYSAGNRGVERKKYRRYVLIDSKGTKLSAVVYDDDVRFFAMNLQPFKRYRISKATVSPAISFFKVSEYPYTWILNHKNVVEKVDEPIVPPIPCTYDLTNFGDIFKHADNDTSLNIKAIVVHAFATKYVSDEISRRDVVVINEEKIPMILTLWNQFGHEEGNQFAAEIRNTPLIIATNMKATTFHGLSLSTRIYSYILVNPPLVENLPLREWYNNNREEIIQFIENKRFKDLDIILPIPNAVDVIDVRTALSTFTHRKSAWVVGEAIFLPSSQRYWYTACGNCNKALEAEVGWKVECSGCMEESRIIVRGCITISLVQDDAAITMTMYSPDIENITKITADQLKHDDEIGYPIVENLSDAFLGVELLCFVKNFERERQGSATKRFTVVKAYVHNNATTMQVITPSTQLKETTDPILEHGPENMVITATTSASVSPRQTPAAEKSDLIPAESLGSEEKQFFTPTTKKVLHEIAATHLDVPTKSSTTVGAKRNLQYDQPIVIAEKDDKKQLTSGSTNIAKLPDDSSTTTESPVKKNKDKVKLN